MKKAAAFVEIPRSRLPKRPTDERVKDWREVEGDLRPRALREQAARCIDCGIPFCHKGCPLGNNIPDWNDLVSRSKWRQASERLHATNNFPEFTGRICPAPCEEACVLNISGEPVTIRQIEKQIVDYAWQQGWIAPAPCDAATGHSVAVVGSGPAGLAAAQQLARVGHEVTVFERDERPGGLLRYGIPDFKMEKTGLERRIEQMQAEGGSVPHRGRCRPGPPSRRPAAAFWCRHPRNWSAGSPGPAHSRAEPGGCAFRHGLPDPPGIGWLPGTMFRIRSARPDDTWSFLAGAIPVPTAWAPPIVRAPGRCITFTTSRLRRRSAPRRCPGPGGR